MLRLSNHRKSGCPFTCKTPGLFDLRPPIDQAKIWPCWSSLLYLNSAIFKRIMHDSVTLTGTWSLTLTPFCNLLCFWCYIAKSQENATKSDISMVEPSQEAPGCRTLTSQRRPTKKVQFCPYAMKNSAAGSSFDATSPTHGGIFSS